MHIACSWNLLAQLPPEDSLPLLRELNLAAVEMPADGIDWARWQLLLAQHDIHVAAIDVGALPLRQVDDVEVLARIQSAGQRGAAVAILDAGSADDDDQRAQRYERLRRCGDAAQQAGLTIALDTRPGLCRTSRGMLRTVQEVGHPAVRLLFDTAGYLDLNPGSSGEIALQRVCPFVAAMRLTDHTGEPGVVDHPPPGQGGEVDLARTLDILRAVAFAGPNLIDVRRARRKRGGSVVEDLRDSVIHLRICGWFD